MARQVVEPSGRSACPSPSRSAASRQAQAASGCRSPRGILTSARDGSHATGSGSGSSPGAEARSSSPRHRGAGASPCSRGRSSPGRHSGRVEDVVVAEAEEDARPGSGRRKGQEPEDPRRGKQVAGRRLAAHQPAGTRPSRAQWNTSAPTSAQERRRCRVPAGASRGAGTAGSRSKTLSSSAWTIRCPAARAPPASACCADRLLEGADVLVPEPLPHEGDRPEPRDRASCPGPTRMPLRSRTACGLSPAGANSRKRTSFTSRFACISGTIRARP